MARDESAVSDDHAWSIIDPGRSPFREGVDAVVHWVLIDADRNLLTFLLAVGVFAVLVASGTIWPFEMRTLLTETRAVQTMFNTLLSGIILLVSIVVSITSVVLSQEVSSLGTQQRRIEDTLDFRESLEDSADTGVSPVHPTGFLSYILDSIQRTASDLRQRIAENPDAEFRDAATTYLDGVVERTDSIRDGLDDTGEEAKDALFIGLAYDYSRHLYAAHRFSQEYDDSLSDAEVDAFQKLVSEFKFFAIGREYFKTLYIKSELGMLSKMLLYVSLPAIVFTSYVLLAIDAGLFPTFFVPGIPRLLTFISFAFVVALSPFILLTAYVIRVVAVSERSLAVGPLVLSGGTMDRDFPEE